eukprot:1616305-Lingulodinium_polyedra.AAC.1
MPRRSLAGPRRLQHNPIPGLGRNKMRNKQVGGNTRQTALPLTPPTGYPAPPSSTAKKAARGAPETPCRNRTTP